MMPRNASLSDSCMPGRWSFLTVIVRGPNLCGECTRSQPLRWVFRPRRFNLLGRNTIMNYHKLWITLNFLCLMLKYHPQFWCLVSGNISLVLFLVVLSIWQTCIWQYCNFLLVLIRKHASCFLQSIDKLNLHDGWTGGKIFLFFEFIMNLLNLFYLSIFYCKRSVKSPF